MASLNNVVRTQNYKRLAAELESKRSRVSELEQKVAATEQEATENATKAEAFDVVADAIGLKNIVHKLIIYTELETPLAQGLSVMFDNKMTSKLLKIKSFTITEEGDKYRISGELANEEKIFDNTGKEVCAISTFELGTSTNEVGGLATSYGDVSMYSGTLTIKDIIDGSSNLLSIDNGADTDESFCLKVPDLSLGEVPETEIQATVDVVTHPDTHPQYVVITFAQDCLTLIPIPAPKAEEA